MFWKLPHSLFARLKGVKYLRRVIIDIQRIRILLWGYHHLPQIVRIEKLFLLDTRNWQTANMCRSGRILNSSLLYEEDEVKIFKKMCLDKKCFFDVGGHIGYYSFTALATSSTIKEVVIFEILDDYVYIINKHIDKNKQHMSSINVEVVDSPVGIEGEQLQFVDTLSSAEKVCISLDNFSKRTGKYPDIIKIDVEGHEFDVLSGMKTILKEYKPALILSTHKKFLEERSHSQDEVIKILLDNNYHIDNVIGGANLFCS